MGTRTVPESISDFHSALKSRGLDVQKLILFGSQATGTAREDSDIDLVVISKDFEGKNALERINILADAVYEVWEPIEPIAKTPEEWESGESMLVQIAREGRVVYEAGG